MQEIERRKNERERGKRQDRKANSENSLLYFLKNVIIMFCRTKRFAQNEAEKQGLEAAFSGNHRVKRYYKINLIYF